MLRDAGWEDTGASPTREQTVHFCAFNAELVLPALHRNCREVTQVVSELFPGPTNLHYSRTPALRQYSQLSQELLASPGVLAAQALTPLQTLGR